MSSDTAGMPGQCRLQGTGWQPGSARTCVARPVPATLLSAQHGRVCAGHTGCPAAHLSTSCTSAPSMRATVWAASASKSVVAAASLPRASELLAAPPAAAAGLLGAVHSGFSECRLYTLAMSASSAGPYCRMAGMMTAQAQQKASQSMQQAAPGWQPRSHQPRAGIQAARWRRMLPARLCLVLFGSGFLAWHKRKVEGLVHKAEPRHVPQDVGEVPGVKLPPPVQAGVRDGVHAGLACRDGCGRVRQAQRWDEHRPRQAAKGWDARAPPWRCSARTVLLQAC